MHIPCPRPLPKKNKQRGGVPSPVVYHILSDFATPQRHHRQPAMCPQQKRKKRKQVRPSSIFSPMFLRHNVSTPSQTNWKEEKKKQEAHSLAGRKGRKEDLPGRKGRKKDLQDYSGRGGRKTWRTTAWNLAERHWQLWYKSITKGWRRLGRSHCSLL
jgi:hypothetical protein